MMRCADCGAVMQLEKPHVCPEPHTPFTGGDYQTDYAPHETPKE